MDSTSNRQGEKRKNRAAKMKACPRGFGACAWLWLLQAKESQWTRRFLTNVRACPPARAGVN